ncbi:MAG: EpsI family protein [Chloroflexi bacterium]|nr:EpsI family protein [Chloroflexota bacterium]
MKASLRYAALLAALSTVAAATLLLSARTTAPPAPEATTTAEPLHTYLLDVAGWYQITPNERAVATPLDFSIDGLHALPPRVGRWTGAPYPLEPEVDEWLQDPEVALSTLYRDDAGHEAWFSVFGSRSQKSYTLFEHTPITSYPAAGWTLLEHGVAPITIGGRQSVVQKATLTKGGERRVVLYWYQWSDFNRDPEQGLLALRLHIPIVSTDQDALNAGADFLGAIYPQVLEWHRF